MSLETRLIALAEAIGLDIKEKVENNDSRLTNAREWTASEVSQAEAEAGTATTARKWTAQRVAQAIGSLGLKIGTTSTTAAAGNDSRIVNAVQTSGNQTIGGIKTFSSFPVTPSAAPTDDYQVVNKRYVDDRVSGLGGSMSGSITLNGTTNNTVVMTNIVTELDLEAGDVIRIDTGAYNKLHTVESITDNDSIIVNYEHAGNRGNGSLKLPDFTGQATVTRIAKWFNAPIGLGQEWVDITGRRANNTTYTNTTGRTIFVSIVVAGYNATSATNFIANGSLVVASYKNQAGPVGSGDTRDQSLTLCAPILNGAEYRISLGAGHRIVRWLELR